MGEQHYLTWASCQVIGASTLNQPASGASTIPAAVPHTRLIAQPLSTTHYIENTICNPRVNPRINPGLTLVFKHAVTLYDEVDRFLSIEKGGILPRQVHTVGEEILLLKRL